jgi:hypothetical protein
MNDTDAGLWHPWRRINRRACHAPRVLERGGLVSCSGRVQASARAVERDPARGVVQPRRATDDATRSKGHAARRVLPAHLGRDGERRTRVGALSVTMRSLARG